MNPQEFLRSRGWFPMATTAYGGWRFPGASVPLESISTGGGATALPVGILRFVLEAAHNR